MSYDAVMRQGVKACLQCGALFSVKPQGTRGPQSKYCSSRCRDKHADLGRYLGHFVCQQCGRPFTKHRKRAKFCSDACKYTSRRLPAKSCVVCGGVFQPGKASQDCCGRACSTAKGVATRLARRFEHRCQRCGATFISTGQHQHQRFCSLRCSRGASTHRRQALKRTGIFEDFEATEIFERDGWGCAICGKLVKRGVTGKHPLQASLDHIVPLSCGGSHMRSNVRCTHLKCNLLRMNREPAQTRLAIAS